MRHVCSLLLLFAAGCTFNSKGNNRDVVFIVPGVGGNTPAYNSLIGGLRDGGVDADIEMFGWGAPTVLFVVNFQNESIHADAETNFAKKIDEWRKQHPGSKISCIGHSAGCGVILGALRRSDQTVQVQNVLLLAPSVSPGYELTGAVERVAGRINVFYSERDDVFLKWRTETFGTYDNVKSPAAGSVGFKSVNDLPPGLRAKVAQFAWGESYQAQGNNGGHHDSLAREFAHQTLAPLLRGNVAATTQPTALR